MVLSLSAICIAQPLTNNIKVTDITLTNTSGRNTCKPVRRMVVSHMVMIRRLDHTRIIPITSVVSCLAPPIISYLLRLSDISRLLSKHCSFLVLLLDECSLMSEFSSSPKVRSCARADMTMVSKQLLLASFFLPVHISLCDLIVSHFPDPEYYKVRQYHNHTHNAFPIPLCVHIGLCVPSLVSNLSRCFFILVMSGV
jgi:hypothetical protein